MSSTRSSCINLVDRIYYISQDLLSIVRSVTLLGFIKATPKVNKVFQLTYIVMMFLLSFIIVAFVFYILYVSFNDAASLLYPEQGPVITSPLAYTIPKSPQEWLSRYIPGLRSSIVTPTAQVGQHEWLSILPHQGPNHGQNTLIRSTNPRKLF